MSRRNKQNAHPPVDKETTVIAQQSFYQGQLPPPEMMEHYQAIIPNLPERIVTMAEKEQSHRHLNESKSRKGIIRSTYVGMVFAFLSVLVISAIVVYAFFLGYATQGATIATGVIVGLAGVFLFRRQIRKAQS